MKWIRYIWILISIYLICSARTCTEDEDTATKREEQHIINLRDSIKSVFISDTLSDQFLKSFEITAIQKLNDFADYLKIISDTSLEVQFRQQAAGLVRDLFVNDKIGLHDWGIIYPEHNPETLKYLIEHCLSDGIPFWIQPSQISIRNSFTRENDSTYLGSLSFYQNRIPFINPEQSEIVIGELVIDIYLIKSLKFIGDQQFKVWDVYLGDIH